LHSEPVYSQNVVVDEKGMLQNVFVYVKEGLPAKTYPAPKTPVTINQQGCMYAPHVLGIQVNQPLQIVNSDPTLHNIHALPKLNDGFNIAQPRKGMKTEKFFTQPEIMVRVKCDVHSWMSCYIGVLDHPFFAVTGSDGTCELRGLPPGEYLIAAWHEKYGTQEQTLVVKAGEEKKIVFTYTAK